LQFRQVTIILVFFLYTNIILDTKTTFRKTRLSLGPTQPPMQCETGAITPEVKRPGREADHSPPSSKKGKVVPVLSLNLASRHEGLLGEWKYISTHSSTSALDGG
jgi:hypothetical protein